MKDKVSKLKIEDSSKKILNEIINASDYKVRLFGINLLIDAFSNNISLKDIDNILKIIKSKTTSQITLDNVQMGIDSLRFIRKAGILGQDFSNVPEQYSRVISKTVFDKFISNSGRRRYTKYKHLQKLEISKTKILKAGWSGFNDIVWITPYELLMNEINKTEPQNVPSIVLDYIGKQKYPNTGSLMKSGNPEFVLIKYSSKFPDKCYKPNATNGDIPLNSLDYYLYISYKKEDSFGRTYNDQKIPFAKERIHEKTFYYDDEFEAYYLGELTVFDTKIDNIIDEAIKRT